MLLSNFNHNVSYAHDYEQNIIMIRMTKIIILSTFLFTTYFVCQYTNKVGNCNQNTIINKTIKNAGVAMIFYNS